MVSVVFGPSMFAYCSRVTYWTTGWLPTASPATSGLFQGFPSMHAADQTSHERIDNK
jgi:hypothetical protein